MHENEGARVVCATINVGSGARSMDRVAVREGPGWTAVALADGAGGMGGGHEAAEAVVASLAGVDAAAWIASRGLAAAATLDALDHRLAVAEGGGQSTAVLLAIAGGRVAGASVGDSAAWCGDRAGWVELTARQERKPLVGDGGATAMAFTAAFTAGRVLVASDGLFKYAPWEAIQEIATAGTVASAVAALAALVRLPRGGLHDDVSIALLGYASA